MITRYPPLGQSSYDPQYVSLSDSAQIDAFSRVRVSLPKTVFDSQQEYGLDLLKTWDATANGTLPTIVSTHGSVVSGSNAVGPVNGSTKMCPITVSGTSGHYSVLQSKQYVRYIPGKSHLVFVTGIFSPGTVANTDARVGYFDSKNGIFVKTTNGAYSIVRRTNTSGSPVDTEIAQASWNVDKFDGTGMSGKTLDLTKTNILFINAQWLGVGRVIVGFDIDGILYPAHQFLNANSLTVPYTQHFNLPVRLELRNTGASTGGTIQFVCASVQSEGGEDVAGFPASASNGITTIGVTTRRPILSIRPRAEYNGMDNRGHIELAEFEATAATNNAYIELIVGGTLTGASWVPVGESFTAGVFVTGVRYVIRSVGTTDFTLIGAASNTVGVAFTATGAGTGTGTAVREEHISEFDVSATAITGGTAIKDAFVLTGSGVVRGFAAGSIDIRNPLVLSKIDSLAATQSPITIVATSFSGTSNITSLMNWHEQTT